MSAILVRSLAFVSIALWSLPLALNAQAPAAPGAPAAQAGGLVPELSKPVTVQFLATPLGKALETLAGYVTVPFVVDKDKLTLDAPVTLDIKNLPLQTVLTQLKKLGFLDFEYRDGVIFITSKNEMFRQRMVSRIYDVRALIGTVPDFNDSPELQLGSVANSGESNGNSSTYSGGPPGERSDELVNLIKETIDKENWNDAGGCASIRKLGHILVISTIPETQKTITDMLGDMQKSYGKTISVEGRYLLIKTTVLDQWVAEKGKGTLVLDPKAADELWSASTQGGADLRVAGTARVVCFNGQRVWLTAGAEEAYVSNLTPVVAEGVNALSPTISAIVKGTTLDIMPTAGWNDEWISVIVRTFATNNVILHEFNTAFLGGYDHSSIRPGTAEISTTQPDQQAAGNRPPKFAEGIKSTLQLPSVEGFRAKTMVKVPNGGAVLISGSSPEIKKLIGEGNEIVLVLRATANK